MSSGRVVYMNGKFVPEVEAKISIFDSALMFGDMVFEMTRSFNKKQFKLREHLERLYIGIKILHIPMKMTILFTSSFIVIVLVYRFIIYPFRITRVLFGMKRKSK